MLPMSPMSMPKSLIIYLLFWATSETIISLCVEKKIVPNLPVTKKYKNLKKRAFTLVLEKNRRAKKFR